MLRRVFMCLGQGHRLENQPNLHVGGRKPMQAQGEAHSWCDSTSTDNINPT